MRLSFTITTTNFWRPDMNDFDRHAHTQNFPVVSISLPTFSYHSHATGKTLVKILSEKDFPLAFSLPLHGHREPPHCLCDTLVHYRFNFQSLNINLRVASCSQIFLLFGLWQKGKNENLFARKTLELHHFFCRCLWNLSEWRKFEKLFSCCVFHQREHFFFFNFNGIFAIVQRCINWHNIKVRKRGKKSERKRCASEIK